MDSTIAVGERAAAISEQSGGLSWLMVNVGALVPRLYWLRSDIARAEQMFERYAYLADEFPG